MDGIGLDLRVGGGIEHLTVLITSGDGRVLANMQTNMKSGGLCIQVHFLSSAVHDILSTHVLCGFQWEGRWETG